MTKGRSLFLYSRSRFPFQRTFMFRS